MIPVDLHGHQVREGTGSGSAVSRTSATNRVGPSPITPLPSNNPCREASSATADSPARHPVTRTVIPAAAPTTRWARTSTAPSATTRLTT